MTKRWVGLVLVWLWLGVEAGAATSHFYFVQITDTHFGQAQHETYVRQAIEEINNLPLPIACVLHTGDIATDNLDDGKTASLATQVMSLARAPVHYTPGNHDILPKRLDATLAAYTNHFGPLATRHEYHGVVFLGVYTEPLDRGFTVPGYDPLAWLARELDAAGDRPVIIYHHIPVADDFYKNKMHPGWPAESRAAWEKTINRPNVVAVLSGHFHRAELHWIGNVPEYVGAPTAGYWNRQPSYRIYEYRDGKLGYRTRHLAESERKRTAERAADMAP